MKFVSKAVAFGATAALATTGLVAAAGASANAADSAPTYSCTLTDGAGTSVPFNVPLSFTMPKVVTGSTIPAGTAVAGTASLADMVQNHSSDPAVAALLGGLSGGSISSLTVTPSAFPVMAAGVVTIPFALSPETLNPTQLGNLVSTLAMPVAGSFTDALKVTFPAGSYTLNLPSTFSLDLSSGTSPVGSVDCDGTAQTMPFVVSPAASTGGGTHVTPPVTHVPTKAEKKLHKDKDKLKKAKKKFKKAHGAKKAKLHKKIVKLKKAVKKDKKAVKAGK